MSDLKKILLINFGGIGDEILFLPVISSLKKTFPDSHITLVLEKRSRCIKDLTNNIDDVYELDIKGENKYSELFKFVTNTWHQKYDMVISSGANKFIPILLFSTFIPKRYGYDSGALSKILLTKSVKLNQNQYAADMYHDLIKYVTEEKTQFPEIKLNDTEKEQNSILIHPGVSKMSIEKNIIKTFNAELWVDIIEQLLQKGKKVYLAGGPDDKETMDIILSGLEQKNILDNPNFMNMYNQTKNIMDLAKLIKKSEILLCTDSAPMHIGVGVGTKTYAIFGPTDEKKLLPNSENFAAITKNTDCRPCLWDKRMVSCDKKDCLKFSAEDILSHF